MSFIGRDIMSTILIPKYLESTILSWYKIWVAKLNTGI